MEEEESHGEQGFPSLWWRRGEGGSPIVLDSQEQPEPPAEEAINRAKERWPPGCETCGSVMSWIIFTLKEKTENDLKATVPLTENKTHST